MQSPDGNVIDCVPHLQPAFDHSKKLRGQKPEVEPEPEERPKVDGAAAAQGEAAEEEVVFPAGVDGRRRVVPKGDESCPKATSRTTRRDVLRSSSSLRFGMKQPRACGVVRCDSTCD
uniref:Neprosin activation peptide domain-containing protein n=1 Tax=Oryza barthii TaxID=65489 RepID=A0A0D3GFK7_9ORYZ